MGADQVARDTTVLGFLDPCVALVAQSGKFLVDWLFAYRTAVGWATTIIAVAVLLGALVRARGQGVPVVLLAAAVVLATWGQIALLSDRTVVGVWLYAAGVVSALVLGVLRPMSRLSGFPQLPLPATAELSGQDDAAAGRVHWIWEGALVTALTVAALFARAYALTELPAGFDLETIDFMVLSRTLHGFREYSLYWLLTNNNGIFHLLTQMLFFHLFGTSLYAVRLAAVFWGTAAVPLLYWLVRRIAGVGPAIVSSLLILAAPEQLYWSRTENNFFAPVGVAGLITVHLGLWMVQRLSPAAVLATALWMPITRFFYAPCIVLFTYPLLLFGHSLVFVRGAWRKASYIAPILVAGLALWVVSLSVFIGVMSGGPWKFIHPAQVHGAPVWRKHGEAAFGGAGFVQLAGLQATLALSNLGEVIRGMTDAAPRMFSQYYLRYHPAPAHETLITAGLAVVVALGFGYLLGQCYERRAFALLAWIVLGVLPGIMSNDPSPRRIALVFPALYAIGGIMIGAAVRVVRASLPSWLGWLTTGALSVAVLGIAWTGLASHLLLGKRPMYFGDRVRFAKPVFENSDVVLHNFDHAFSAVLVLGNLDRFMAAPPCYRSVAAQDWRDAALRGQCQFTDPLYAMVFTPEQLAAVSRSSNPQRISFLLWDNEYSRAQIALLNQLYPQATVRRHTSSVDEKTLVHVAVDRADVEALHAPSLRTNGNDLEGRGLADKVLAGVRLAPGPAIESRGARKGAIVIEGGMQIDRDGWYRFQIGPSCPEATLLLDQQPSTSLQPMQAGLHAFEIRLPSATACRLPLQVLAQSAGQEEPMPVDPSLFVSPAVVAIAELQAVPILPFDGFGDARLLANLTGSVIDMGVDGQGAVSVLLVQEGVFRVRRFRADGQADASWTPVVPPGRVLNGMVIDRDGTAILMSDNGLLIYDRAGNQIGTWDVPWAVVPTDIALSPDGHILLAVPSRASIVVLSRTGELQGEIKQFAGGPGLFSEPASVTAGPSGYVLVIQADGRALLLRGSPDLLNLTFVRSFPVHFPTLPIHARGAAFATPDQIVVPDEVNGLPMVYNLAGQRMMAAVPARDLQAKELGQVIQFQATTDRLYALDRALGRLWSVAR